MSSMKAFLKPLIEKNEVILISDDEDEQDSRDTNVTGRVLKKHRQTSNSATDCNEKKTNGTPPLCEPQVICKTEPPVLFDEIGMLIRPVPVNEGETFNRADYQVPPLLVEMTEQSNRIMVEFLSTCMPLITEKDRPLIMRRLKDILSQTNLHYLASDRFRQTVASIARSVQEDSSSANVYLRIKELADELRSRREKKSKKKGTLPSGPSTGGSNASSAAVTGSSGEDTSDSKCIIPAMCVAFDSVASQARLSASKSPTPSPTNAVPDSTSVVQTETSSVAAGTKDCVSESKKLVGTNHEEKCSNGVDSMGETSSVSQKSEKQLRTEKHIKKLEKHLIQLHRAIKKLREEEVDLSCDDINSAYIQEDRFKKKAVAVWRKICELEHRRAFTGCEREKKFHYKGTRFVEINTRVEKLVNKRRIFPDFKDILDVVQSENETKGLGLNSREEKNLAQDVFEEVGRELQKRRQRDELADALAYLEDGPGSAFMGDPAESDKELLEKLENNAKLSRRRIDEVIQVYVAKQEELKLEAKEVEQDNCDQSPKPSDDSGSEDEDEDDNDDDLRAPRESLLENDTSLSESPVEQEKTKLDPQERKQDICDLSSASSNSSEGEDSEDERENCKEEKYSRFIEKDRLGNDRSSNEDAKADEADAADAKEEEADAKEEADAEATCRVNSPITVEDKESSSRLLADGDSHSVLEDKIGGKMPNHGKRATKVSGRLLPGSPTIYPNCPTSGVQPHVRFPVVFVQPEGRKGCCSTGAEPAVAKVCGCVPPVENYNYATPGRPYQGVQCAPGNNGSLPVRPVATYAVPPPSQQQQQQQQQQHQQPCCAGGSSGGQQQIVPCYGGSRCPGAPVPAPVQFQAQPAGKTVQAAATRCSAAPSGRPVPAECGPGCHAVPLVPYPHGGRTLPDNSLERRTYGEGCGRVLYAPVPATRCNACPQPTQQFSSRVQPLPQQHSQQSSRQYPQQYSTQSGRQQHQQLQPRQQQQQQQPQPEPQGHVCYRPAEFHGGYAGTSGASGTVPTGAGHVHQW
ncbi:uncharacterized protein [Dermacentor andersoni]|uniref:uncharacterized protein isoform X2 n=2 Tax=Dermacentor andersoni TaxID=34620 RepID=UPI0024168BF5|nr:uncharacterized protein LOC126547757 isoform X2 [Dermacentor andersoni]